jgi:heme/copper-type cytochrome/quinol oxidase subunit 1
MHRRMVFVSAFLRSVTGFVTTQNSSGWALWKLRYALHREVVWLTSRSAAFVADWVLTTNHRRLAILYFALVSAAGFTGLILATLIRLELAYPGQVFLAQNAERYLTVISLHGIIMVFYVVIPALFGAFGNFLIPTQLGIRDVAFPRLNSFMYWVTPGGFVLLLHILLFDRAYNLTY